MTPFEHRLVLLVALVALVAIAAILTMAALSYQAPVPAWVPLGYAAWRA